MNFKKLMRGLAMLCAGSILWVSCQKGNEGINVPAEKVTDVNVRQSGVVPDDPALVAKVPIIASTDFLASSITNYLSSQPQVESAKGGGGSRDRTTPQVTITNPVSGSVVSGSVAVQVNATDNVGVVSVALKADGNVVGTITTAPFTFSWNTAGLSSGTHTLTATATDAAGNAKTHTIQVGYNTASGADITPPSINVTSPVNGSSVSSTISVAVSASDNVGVSNVTLYVDGAVSSSDATAPYSFSLSNMASGIHSITATAIDAAGNSNSTAVQVTVNTTVVPPPTTLPASIVLAMPPVANQGSEGNCSSFAVAYAARSCEQYYRSNASSYSFSSNIFSPEFLYNQIVYGTCGATSILTNLDFIVNKGVCTWATMPYSYMNGCSLQPTPGQTAEAANYKIASYAAVYTADITAMKTMLANKHPLIMAFGNENNFNNAGPGYIWKSKDASNGFGSHAITICGYDDAKRAYKAINSWGTTWGDGGYIWIDYDFLPSVASTVYVIN